MDNMRAIRMRIKSLQSTQQVTKSMKMVSAAKLRRAQNAYGKLKTFAETSNAILSEVVGDIDTKKYPLLTLHPQQKRVCYVLFVGNRGLCGVYHQAVLRFLSELTEQETRECFLVVCGRWEKESIEKTGVSIERWFEDIDDIPTVGQAHEITSYLKELYLSRKADEIVLVYQQYESVLLQTPARKTLLPVPVETHEAGQKQAYIFEPQKGRVLKQLFNLYIENTVYAALLEAKVSEHAARMTAMTSASDNADDLIGSLRLKLNHARQAAITTEIAEISGGAAVLNKEKN